MNQKGWIIVRASASRIERLTTTAMAMLEPPRNQHEPDFDSSAGEFRNDISTGILRRRDSGGLGARRLQQHLAHQGNSARSPSAPPPPL